MTVQATDTFLVSRGGVLHQVTAANANSKVADSDILLVNRAGVDYYITGANFKAAAFQDADLYLVNRTGTDYKATGAEVKAILSSAPVVVSVTLADSPQAGRFTSATFASTLSLVEGNPVSTKGIKAWVEGALKTQSLSSPIAKVTPIVNSEYFGVLSYTGAAQSPRTLTGLKFTPSLVWVKNRSISSGHYLWDAVRGTDKNLRTDATLDEVTVSADANGKISTSTTGGFIVKSGDTTGTNVGSAGSNPFVAYCWDAGSSTVTNTAGSITSSVRANPSAGFSIVTYTGNGSPSATVGHGLGAVPGMVIVKERSTTRIWVVKHKKLASGFSLNLSNQEAITPYGNGMVADLTSSTTFGFLAGGTVLNVNGSGSTYVAYCFAPVDKYSAFDSFTGGSTVNCGFRPRFVMVKRTDAAGDWEIVDEKHGTNALKPGTPDGEAPAKIVTGLTGTGFSTTGAGSYVYAAFGGERVVELELSDATGLTGFDSGDAVTEVGNGDDGTGVVTATNAGATPPTMRLTDVAGTWDVGSQVKGPLKAPTGGATVKMYCQLNAGLTVTDLQSADPGFTAVAGSGPYTLTWPATLPTGNPPDTDLPAGTTLTTEVQATNSVGTSTKTSNTITPA